MPHASHRLVCALVNYHWCGRLCFVGATVSKDGFLMHIHRWGRHKSLWT